MQHKLQRIATLLQRCNHEIATKCNAATTNCNVAATNCNEKDQKCNENAIIGRNWDENATRCSVAATLQFVVAALHFVAISWLQRCINDFIAGMLQHLRSTGDDFFPIAKESVKEFIEEFIEDHKIEKLIDYIKSDLEDALSLIKSNDRNLMYETIIMDATMEAFVTKYNRACFEDTDQWGFLPYADMIQFIEYLKDAPIIIMKDHLFKHPYLLWFGFVEAVVLEFISEKEVEKEESEWETLYSIEKVSYHAMLLRTYGGGPEGGYIVYGRYIKENGFYNYPEGYTIASAHRDWGEPWQTSTLTDSKIYYRNKTDYGESIRIVAKNVELVGDDDEIIYEFGVGH
jgi:hypothetical protein